MNNLIAHRGLKINARENTLKAFQNALNNPHYAGFECDIRTSKDGVFVICHNPLIKEDIISLTNYKDLKAKYNLPTLNDVLKISSSKIFLFEIKEEDLNIPAFQKIIQRHKNKNIYVMSFSNKLIKKMIMTKKSEKYGVLNYLFNSEEDYQAYDFICLLEIIMSPKIMAYFQNKKIETFIYGIHHFKKTSQEYSNSYLITDEIIK